MFSGISSARPYLEAGTLRALAVTGEKRNPAVPDVTTFAEVGFADVTASTYWGVLAPKGTPKEVLAAVINNTFFGDGQAKGGLGEMPSASRRDTVPCMHSGESGKCGNPSCDAPSGCPSADLAVLSTVMSRSKR